MTYEYRYYMMELDEDTLKWSWNMSMSSKKPVSIEELLEEFSMGMGDIGQYMIVRVLDKVTMIDGKKLREEN